LILFFDFIKTISIISIYILVINIISICIFINWTWNIVLWIYINIGIWLLLLIWILIHSLVMRNSCFDLYNRVCECVSQIINLHLILICGTIKSLLLNMVHVLISLIFGFILLTSTEIAIIIAIIQIQIITFFGKRWILIRQGLLLIINRI
jgi:hypothetical protein